MRIIVTGGCGFVGHHLALGLKKNGYEVCCFDNLTRRGSERTIPLLRSANIDFIHGDVRCREDLEEAGTFAYLIDCSAEPSVRAGYDGSPARLLSINLQGTLNCLDYARIHGAGIIFLSTSRVYPLQSLRTLPLLECGDRLDISAEKHGVGWSRQGITRDFPLHGARTMYGASKLACELCIHEFGSMYDMPYIINRCGVIAGPGQMGKVDQGFFSLWVARHYWKVALTYQGFGGCGLQVRDVLHIQDLVDLICLQISHIDAWKGLCWNVGGGRENSLSLQQLTALCCKATGNSVPMHSQPQTANFDIPWYITDNTEIANDTGWIPKRGIETIMEDTLRWLRDDEVGLRPFFVS